MLRLTDILTWSVRLNTPPGEGRRAEGSAASCGYSNGSAGGRTALTASTHWKDAPITCGLISEIHHL